MQKILFSNIGYAKGIDGTLSQHIKRFHRHLYSGQSLQQDVLKQLKIIIDTEQPDLCCFVEIDQGSLHTARVNQMQFLLDDNYACHDIADKYGERSWLGRMPLHMGKSNGFMAKQAVAFERLYFRNGTKRLFYKIQIAPDIQLLFGHFSLQKTVRARQFAEIKELIANTSDKIILLGDFNIMHGFIELDELCQTTDLHILNNEDDHTFRFHKRQLALDLCVCSNALRDRLSLTIIPQPFSDHAALVIQLDA